LTFVNSYYTTRLIFFIYSEQHIYHAAFFHYKNKIDFLRLSQKEGRCFPFDCGNSSRFSKINLPALFSGPGYKRRLCLLSDGNLKSIRQIIASEHK